MDTLNNTLFYLGRPFGKSGILLVLGFHCLYNPIVGNLDVRTRQSTGIVIDFIIR